jgi:dihydrofolate reductase
VISLIAAVARNRVIGAGNRLPWRLPADLRRFRALTMGHPVVMGRKTYESIGRPLPGRTNIVLTRQAGYQAPGCVVVSDLDEALRAAGDATAGGETGGEVFIIGGADLYRQTLARAGRLYLTEVAADVPDGDAFFPEIDPALWQEVERIPHQPDARHPYAYAFVTYVRRPALASD